MNFRSKTVGNTNHYLVRFCTVSFSLTDPAKAFYYHFIGTKQNRLYLWIEKSLKIFVVKMPKLVAFSFLVLFTRPYLISPILSLIKSFTLSLFYRPLNKASLILSQIEGRFSGFGLFISQRPVALV